MDVRQYNREAWDQQVGRGNPWTVPVSPAKIASAREGIFSVLLTPTRPVPMEWFPDLKDLKVLCLASGGGQQAALLAAAGAEVTVFDNSPAQLAQDRTVAEREGLRLEIIEGDMANLSIFADETFDLIFHPVSNVFVPFVRPVWMEAYRVLKSGGSMLAGFVNPLLYLFDTDLLEEKGELVVRHAIPYSDVDSLTPEQKQRFRDEGLPLEFGHTLEDQIGGQLEAGFLISGFYEDIDPRTVLGKLIPTYMATQAVKPVFQT